MTESVPGDGSHRLACRGTYFKLLPKLAVKPTVQIGCCKRCATTWQCWCLRVSDGKRAWSLPDTDLGSMPAVAHANTSHCRQLNELDHIVQEALHS